MSWKLFRKLLFLVHDVHTMSYAWLCARLGQRRELIIKKAERVSHRILHAHIAEIQEGLSDGEP